MVMMTSSSATTLCCLLALSAVAQPAAANCGAALAAACGVARTKCKNFPCASCQTCLITNTAKLTAAGESAEPPARSLLNYLPLVGRRSPARPHSRRAAPQQTRAQAFHGARAVIIALARLTPARPLPWFRLQTGRRDQILRVRAAAAAAAAAVLHSHRLPRRCLRSQWGPPRGRQVDNG